MGIYIKNKTINPNGECSYCDFCDSFGWCYALNEDLFLHLPSTEEYFPNGWHYSGCPVVNVATPHGNLIDESVAYDKIAEQEGGNYIDMDLVDIGLQETPVIISVED